MFGNLVKHCRECMSSQSTQSKYRGGNNYIDILKSHASAWTIICFFANYGQIKKKNLRSSAHNVTDFEINERLTSRTEKYCWWMEQWVQSVENNWKTKISRTAKEPVCVQIWQSSHPIGPLHDLVTWYGINYAETPTTQWDFQNKDKSGWNCLKVPLRYMRPYHWCDRIVPRAY